MTAAVTTAVTVLGASSASDAGLWTDLLKVVAYGSVAGVGIAIAFSLALRGLILSGASRRDGKTAAATGHLLTFAVFATVCIAAVVVALASILHR